MTDFKQVDFIETRKRALERFSAHYEKPELDSIDIAYLQLENPLIVLSVPQVSSVADRKWMLAELQRVTRYAIAVLPPGYNLRVIGPQFTSAPPAELARWADDGGRV